MKQIKTKAELQILLNEIRKENKTIGFVPTMGALHEGHLSLIRKSVKENDITVSSVFVNPTQFNNPTDLEKYPRDVERDYAMLEGSGCNYLFTPEVKEMYPPEEESLVFDFGKVESVMEGEFRPGHFRGVGQIVSKLFDAVKPNRAYFGLKDFQQLVVIKALVKQCNYDIEIVPCDIIRESDGVAMSSRNTLLTKEHRQVAPIIFKTLSEAREKKSSMTIEETQQWVIEQINALELLEVEYFSIVDDEELQQVTSWENKANLVGCIAVYAGEVRLIDNIIF